MGHATARATAPEIPTTPKTTNEFQEKFLQMGSDTKHIVAQTDRIAAHLLDGPTGERRNAARTLVAQVEQIGCNQALLIHLVEQILQRLPPVQVQGDPSKLQ
ncbi:MAG: hypothetical protein B7X48_09845 [Acidiphilium sp. 34-60-192]|nr:MAG: hypothetical protein B7X48_09845 [Acidiphilium sp. 34-60-192]